MSKKKKKDGGMIDPRKHVLVSTKTLRQINNPWTRSFEEMKEKLKQCKASTLC